MRELEVLEHVATDAIYRMRLDTLKDGDPFMINIEGLQKNQCYLEYPNGLINLVAFDRDRNDFSLIRTLSSAESLSLRQSMGLI